MSANSQQGRSGSSRRGKALLSHDDRIAEILYGTIMTLTFTCTFSIIKSNKGPIDDMLIGAVGCNIAWGLVDAVMYLVMTLSSKNRSHAILNFIRKSKNNQQSLNYIADALPTAIAAAMPEVELEKVRQRLLETPNQPDADKLGLNNYKTAGAIFILVIISTLPITLPFVLISNTGLALRVSNLIGILVMFLCGWSLGKYAGRNSFLMGLTMSLLGIVLVIITILLGG